MRDKSLRFNFSFLRKLAHLYGEWPRFKKVALINRKRENRMRLLEIFLPKSTVFLKYFAISRSNAQVTKNLILKSQ